MTKEFHVSSPHSWHAKLYIYWLNGGKNKPGYQENFCHYWRVALIYAPLIWLLTQKVGGTLPPMVLIAWYGAVIAMISFITAHSMLLNIGIASVLMVFLVAVLVGIRFLATQTITSLKKRFPTLADRAGNVFAIGISMALIGAILSGLIAGAMHSLLWTGLGIATLLAGVSLGTAALQIKKWWVARRCFNRASKPKRESASHNVILSNVAETARFFGQIVIAKKQSVCPGVVFDFNLKSFLKEEKQSKQS